MFLCLSFIALYFLAVFNAKITHQATLNTLAFCANKLVPSLFPFMVISSVFSDALIGKFSKNTRLKMVLFTLSAWLSGFVTGSKKLCEFCDNEDLTPYVFLTSNAGVGFTVSFIGIYLWNSCSFGIFLYVLQLISSFLVFKIAKKSAVIITSQKKIPIITSFTQNVKQSTMILLEICGFTLVFSIIRVQLQSVLNLKANSILSILFSSVLEVSEGAFLSSNAQNYNVGLFFTGFCLGFGGICMCLQTYSACKGCFSISRFVILKLIQGLICGSICYVLSFYFKLSDKTVQTSFCGEIDKFSVFINCCLLFLTLTYIKKFLKNKTIVR